MKLSLLLSGALLATLGQGAAALDPEPFDAFFGLESHGVTIGETRWQLQREPGGFVLEARSEAAGIATLLGENRVVERSQWKRGDTGLLPAAYRYERSGKREKLVSIAFDWDAGVVYNTAAGETWRMDVPDGTVDKLSYLLKLMADLAAGERDVSYPIADGGKLKTYRLHVAGSATLETELGAVEVLEVVRERPDSDRETTLWMAPELGFLPVLIEHREPDGESVTMKIRSLGSANP